MGKSTSVVSNHNLDISSLKALAIDLSNRLKATIDYGYSYTFLVNPENELDYDIDFKSQGKIEVLNSKRSYQLIDEKLGQKLFIEEKGIEILDSKEFVVSDYLKEFITEDLKATEYELIANDTGDNIATIYEKCIDYWIQDSLSWSYFQNIFLYHAATENIDFINNWRAKIQKWVTLFGGTYMFVYCSEEDSYKVQEWLEKDSLETLLPKITTEFEGKLVTIPAYFLSEKYKEKEVYIQKPISDDFFKKYFYAEKKGIDFYPIKLEFPILFYDDFADLDPGFNTNKYFDFVYNGAKALESLKKLNHFQTTFQIKRDQIKLPALKNFFKLYYCHVTGLKYYQSSHLETELKINEEVFLVRQPENEYDKHAIALFVNYDDGNETYKTQIGYISQNENYMLSKLLDEQFELRAFLTKINEKDLDNRNYNFALEITIFMKKNKVEKQILTNKTKVFELGAEGGSLSIYQFLDKDNKDWYFHNVNDMGLDDEIPTTIRNSEYSMSYAEAFIKMQTKYPKLFNLHPLYVHPDFVNETILFLKECLVENKESVDYYTWAAVLKVSEEELGR